MDHNFAALGVPQEILAYTLGALNRGDSLSQKIRFDKDRRDRLEAELNNILEHNQTSIPHLLAAASLRCEQMIISCELGGASEILEADRCCSEIFKSRPLTSMGPCISTHGYTRYQNYPGASMGLSVMLRVFSSSWLNRSVLSDVAQADGYKVILTANYESPSLAATMRAHSINPGRKTFLGIQAVRNFRSSPLGHPTHQVEHSGMNVYPVRSDACGDVDLTTAPTKSVHDLMDDYPYSWNCVERIFREATINSSCKCYPADTLSSEELQNLNLSVCRPETYMWCMRQEVASDTYADLVYERAAPIEGGKRSTARMCPENSYHRAPATHLATPEDQILAFPTLASPFPKFHQLPHVSAAFALHPIPSSSTCKKECKPLCTESSYEALVTYDHLNPAYAESVIKHVGCNLTQTGDVAMFGVHYNMLSERVISYSAYAIIDLISSTGGILSLIFGGSFMTVIQFITFNVWLYRRLVL
ncbi:unnamed protein product [Darwinula stevensoni]|uniref:Amiloride-sensitive sodium channel n=1 Tax=Darwinula stevensoni TaxID=69355 RepID=A0A7R9A2X3_9CRUS|nr:unnamed protein product [Darwinula stevensoni]CAG0886549.1 unnamed protein product [Darwinula stevensoni]